MTASAFARPRPGGARPGAGAGRAPGPAKAGNRWIRRAFLRASAVVLLALAGLLVFGLLPGGGDAPAMGRFQHPLPAAPAGHGLHPHGPNRPASQG